MFSKLNLTVTPSTVSNKPSTINGTPKGYGTKLDVGYKRLIDEIEWFGSEK